MNALRNPQLTGIVWLIARVWLGYEWLMGGIEKVFGPESAAWVGDKAGAGVAGFLNGAIAKSPLNPEVGGAHPAVSTWYATLARDVFLPNAEIFGYLVAYGELLVGIALILGIFTRFSALMGVIMNFAFMYAGSAGANVSMVLIGMLIVTVGGVAVGYYGLDYFARPIETRLIKRTRERFFPTPQAV